MNRIILIGNGFDLAHGLKTNYGDFIDDYWDKIKNNLKSKPSYYGNYDFYFNDDNVDVNIKNTYLPNITIEIIKENTKFINDFLEIIVNKLTLENWIDIEEKYYELLKTFAINDGKNQVEKLNNELVQIKQKLECYLSEIQKIPISTNKDLFYQIYSPLHIEDFTEQSIPILRYTYRNLCPAEKQQEFDKIFDWVLENDIKHHTQKDYDDYVSGINGMGLFPENVWFLNFNYTDTENHYLTINDTLNTNFHVYLTSDLWTKMCASRKIIHIHGELNNENNPIIFGYGDELADEYRAIEKLNDNVYMKNVKSINYLKTDNYKRLLNFINTDNYQIFVMGHSCGNSDRTLLNTLFEHKNCVSIKPFYHKKSKETDNYEEIVMNISRNFTDKRAFREKVVNKTYCEPLTQILH